MYQFVISCNWDLGKSIDGNAHWQLQWRKGKADTNATPYQEKRGEERSKEDLGTSKIVVVNAFFFVQIKRNHKRKKMP